MSKCWPCTSFTQLLNISNAEQWHSICHVTSFTATHSHQLCTSMVQAIMAAVKRQTHQHGSLLFVQKAIARVATTIQYKRCVCVSLQWCRVITNANEVCPSYYVNAFNANLLSAITTLNSTQSSRDTSTHISSAESERTPGVSHWRHEAETFWGFRIKCCNINQEVIWIH